MHTKKNHTRKQYIWLTSKYYHWIALRKGFNMLYHMYKDVPMYACSAMYSFHVQVYVHIKMLNFICSSSFSFDPKSNRSSKSAKHWTNNYSFLNSLSSIKKQKHKRVIGSTGLWMSLNKKFLCLNISAAYLTRNLLVLWTEWLH